MVVMVIAHYNQEFFHHLDCYQLRKLEELGFVKKEKFFIDNESSLKCWKWFITESGYKYKTLN